MRVFIALVVMCSFSVSYAQKDAQVRVIPTDGKVTVVGTKVVVPVDVKLPTKAATSQPVKASPVKVSIAPTATTVTPEDIKGFADDAKKVWGSFKAHDFRAAIAGLITLLMFLWRRFLSKLLVGKIKDDFWLALITTAMGFLGALPIYLTAQKFTWVSFIWNGVLTSAEAILFYHLLGKKLFPKVFGEIPKSVDTQPPVVEPVAPVEPKPVV